MSYSLDQSDDVEANQLLQAIAANNDEAFCELIDTYADLRKIDIIFHSDGGDKSIYLVHYLASIGSLDMLRALAEYEEIKLDQQSDDGITPLMLAAEQGELEVVLYLLEQGAEYDAQDLVGLSPLLYAVREGYVAVVKALLEKGADINLADDNDYTPFMLAEDELIKGLLILYAEDFDAFKYYSEGKLFMHHLDDLAAFYREDPERLVLVVSMQQTLNAWMQEEYQQNKAVFEIFKLEQLLPAPTGESPEVFESAALFLQELYHRDLAASRMAFPSGHYLLKGEIPNKVLDLNPEYLAALDLCFTKILSWVRECEEEFKAAECAEFLNPEANCLAILRANIVAGEMGMKESSYTDLLISIEHLVFKLSKYDDSLARKQERVTLILKELPQLGACAYGVQSVLSHMQMLMSDAIVTEFNLKKVFEEEWLIFARYKNVVPGNEAHVPLTETLFLLGLNFEWPEVDRFHLQGAISFEEIRWVVDRILWCVHQYYWEQSVVCAKEVNQALEEWINIFKITFPDQIKKLDLTDPGMSALLNSVLPLCYQSEEAGVTQFLTDVFGFDGAEFELAWPSFETIEAKVKSRMLQAAFKKKNIPELYLPNLEIAVRNLDETLLRHFSLERNTLECQVIEKKITASIQILRELFDQALATNNVKSYVKHLVELSPDRAIDFILDLRHEAGIVALVLVKKATEQIKVEVLREKLDLILSLDQSELVLHTLQENGTKEVKALMDIFFQTY